MLVHIRATYIWLNRSPFSLHDAHQLRGNTSRGPTTSSQLHTSTRNILPIRSYTFQLEETTVHVFSDGAVENDEPSSLRNLADDCKPSLPALKQLSVEATSRSRHSIQLRLLENSE
jgi:hypothetical protein